MINIIHRIHHYNFVAKLLYYSGFWYLRPNMASVAIIGAIPLSALISLISITNSFSSVTHLWPIYPPRKKYVTWSHGSEERKVKKSMREKLQDCNNNLPHLHRHHNRCVVPPNNIAIKCKCRIWAFWSLRWNLTTSIRKSIKNWFKYKYSGHTNMCGWFVVDF